MHKISKNWRPIFFLRFIIDFTMCAVSVLLLDVLQCHSTRKIGNLQENDRIVHYRIEKSAPSIQGLKLLTESDVQCCRFFFVKHEVDRKKKHRFFSAYLRFTFPPTFVICFEMEAVFFMKCIS